MTFVPKDLLVQIVRYLGHQGFRELAPFIASGRDGKEVAFEEIVLKEADIDEFIFVSSLANEDSIYRPFFERCYFAGNVTARYVEGIRILVKTGPSEHALSLIKTAEEYIVYATFAYGIFSICSRSYEVGMITLQQLNSSVTSMAELIEIGEIVMSQVADIEPPGTGNFRDSCYCPAGDIPNCINVVCSRYDMFSECYAYWYCCRIREVC